MFANCLILAFLFVVASSKSTQIQHPNPTQFWHQLMKENGIRDEQIKQMAVEMDKSDSFIEKLSKEENYKPPRQSPKQPAFELKHPGKQSLFLTLLKLDNFYELVKDQKELAKLVQDLAKTFINIKSVLVNNGQIEITTILDKTENAVNFLAKQNKIDDEKAKKIELPEIVKRMSTIWSEMSRINNGENAKERKMSDEDSEVVQQRDISKKRRIFTIDEKLEVVDFIKSHSINEASRKFKIDRQNIREWQKRKQKLLSLRESKSGKRLRLDGAGRHLRDKEFDDQMIAWIRTQRACNQRVSRRTIQIHALQIANQADEEETIFKTCGITNAFDGSEDGEIHCFKEDGPVPNGKIRLQQAREMAEFDILAEGIAGLFEEVDVEQDEENGFISDGSVEL
uniref:Brinker DNA-binding domain-containing protein n=1 Tax=Globodera rostochiensis TaxID=31243 RepID=A0A914H4G4_GLORO